jgi:hypothetical protein
VISWGSITYGAALSGLFTAVVVAVVTRRPGLVIALALSAAAAPVGWNAVLRATHAGEFFTDAPLAVLPISWQDTGSGVTTLALAALVAGLGPLSTSPGRRLVGLAVLTGAIALLVDVYLY